MIKAAIFKTETIFITKKNKNYKPYEKEILVLTDFLFFLENYVSFFRIY